MNVIGRPAGLLIGALVFLLGSGIQVCAQEQYDTTPRKGDERRWHIAYYEGGEHINYFDNLFATIAGLMELGWIKKTPLPDLPEKNTQALWQWLVDQAESDHLRFLSDGFYSAHWSKDARTHIRDQLLDRLKAGEDIDLIIAMGTWAGKDLANDQHSTPTMVISASDPVQSQIIKSVEDSGYDHVHARVDPRRYERQIQVFHDLIGFKKLGIAYENTPNGRTYAALDVIESFARERGFEIVPCYTQSDIADMDLAGRSVLSCFERLAPQVDALYVTIQGGVNVETIPAIVDIAHRHRVPTFSQLGSEEVRSGILLSLSRPGFGSVGNFLAATMGQIFNGASPRSLPQLFEETSRITINLKTAELIGFYLYADVLAAADEIFRSIETSSP